MVLPDEETIRDRLRAVACLAGQQIASECIEVEIRKAPHMPSALPPGKIAVYAFFHDARCLKVGKVGRKCSPRYASQHYNPTSSNSNLAKSILESPDKICISPVDPVRVGEWIKANTDRINILFPSDWDIPFLTLAEAFLQFWLRPIYEGFESQR
jgi:hypothetical protein